MAGGVVLPVKNPAFVDRYGVAFSHAAKDFLKRNRMANPPTPDQFIGIVRRATEDPAFDLLVALDTQWRLIGFAVVVTVETYLGDPESEVPFVYLRPGRTSSAVSVAMRNAIDETAKGRGSKRVTIVSNRDKPRAWACHGYRPIGTVYAKEISVNGDQ